MPTLDETLAVREENELAFQERQCKGDSPHSATTAGGAQGMTTLQETVATIEAEGLDRFAYVIGGDHGSSTNALVLTQQDGVWTSFCTNERAGVEETSICTYEDLSRALDDFLRLMRLRADEDALMSRIREKNRLAHETWQASRDDRPGKA